MIADAGLSRPPAWGRALCIAGGLHAAAIGALFVHLSPSMEPTMNLPAIAVELAAPAAPPAPVHDTPTPRQIEAPQQTPTKPQPVKKLPFDPPPPQLAQDVQPEVVLPLQEKQHPTAEMRNPLPPAPTTTEQAAPDLKPDAKTTALITGGASAGDITVADRWDARLRARIEVNKRYPNLAMQNNQQDDVHVELTIERTGKLRDAHITSSRGFEILNDAALEAVRRAAPFDSAPKEVEGDLIRVSVIVHFFQ